MVVGLEETGSEVEELEEDPVQKVLVEEREEEAPEGQGHETGGHACVRGRKASYCVAGVAQTRLWTAVDHGGPTEDADLWG